MKKKAYRAAKPFIKKLLKDPEIRIIYEEERAKTLIAEAVRSARIHAGLTQSELAQIAHTTQAVISRIESGTDRRTASSTLLAKIRAACKAKLSTARAQVGRKFKSNPKQFLKMNRHG